MTYADVLAAGVARLKAAGVPSPTRDARRLLAAALNCAAERISLALSDPADREKSKNFQELIGRRVQRQPVSQIVGQRQFWGREFIVTQDVLDPRPETETLIAAALKAPAMRILDLGSGTGCIALTLLAEKPEASAVLTDISPAALAICEANASALGVQPRATSLHSDWFESVEGRFDLIVSNPPYISAAEMPDLAPDVRDWEPHLALTPGGDGLSAYRSMAAGIADYIAPKGCVFLEIGLSQGGDVLEIFSKTKPSSSAVLTDLDGRDRVVALQY